MTRKRTILSFICSLSTAWASWRCGIGPERRQIADDVRKLLRRQRVLVRRHRRLDETMRSQLALHERTELLLPIDHADVERVESQQPAGDRRAVILDDTVIAMIRLDVGLRIEQRAFQVGCAAGLTDIAKVRRLVRAYAGDAMARRAVALAVEDELAARDVALDCGCRLPGCERTQIRDDLSRLRLGDVRRRHWRVGNALTDDARQIRVGQRPPELARRKVDPGNQVAVGPVAVRATALVVGTLAVQQVLSRFVLRRLRAQCDGGGGYARRDQGAGEREAGKKVTHTWQ